MISDLILGLVYTLADILERTVPIDLDELLDSDSFTDQDLALRMGVVAGDSYAGSPYRSMSLAQMIQNHRRIYRELELRFRELEQSAILLNRAFNVRVVGYPRGSSIRKWLVRRAWKRIASHYYVPQTLLAESNERLKG